MVMPPEPGTYELYARFNGVNAPVPFPISLTVISKWANSAQTYISDREAITQ